MTPLKVKISSNCVPLNIPMTGQVNRAESMDKDLYKMDFEILSMNTLMLQFQHISKQGGQPLPTTRLKQNQVK